jgi:hypothetical protein
MPRKTSSMDVHSNEVRLSTIALNIWKSHAFAIASAECGIIGRYHVHQIAHAHQSNQKVKGR